MDVERIKQWPSEAIAGLEDYRIPFKNYIYVFFSAVFVRFFVESFSQQMNLFDVLSIMMRTMFIHFTFAYMTMMMSLSLLFHYALKIPIEKVLRVMLPFTLILILAPSLDIVFTAGQGVDLTYLLPGKHVDVLKTYLTFMGGYDGWSLGMRVEIAIALCICFIYCAEKGCGVLKRLFMVWAVYTLLFLLGSAPFLVKAVMNMFGYSYQYSGGLMANYFLLTNFILFFWVAYLFNKNLFIEVFRGASLLRFLYLELTLAFGAAIAFSLQYVGMFSYMRMYPVVVINELLSIISVFFVSLFIYLINKDGSDTDRKKHQGLAYMFMWFALVYSIMATTHAFAIISAVLGCFYLYSMLPIQFKRVVFLSKFAIGFSSFAILLLGFIFVQHGAYEFPDSLAWIYLAGVTIAANFLDLQGVAVRGETNVPMLPTVIGYNRTKLLTGSAFFFISISLYCVLNEIWSLPFLILVGVGYFYLINKRVYEEWKVILLCNLHLACMSLYLVWG